MKWSSVTETRYCNYFIRYFLLSSCYWSNVSDCKILGTRRPFPESPETFRAHFGSHNSLCIFKAKESRGRMLRSYFNVYSFYNLWKEQLNRVSGSQFCEWLFEPEKFSELSRNRPQGRGEEILVVYWQYERTSEGQFASSSVFSLSREPVRPLLQVLFRSILFYFISHFLTICYVFVLRSSRGSLLRNDQLQRLRESLWRTLQEGRLLLLCGRRRVGKYMPRMPSRKYRWHKKAPFKPSRFPCSSFSMAFCFVLFLDEFKALCGNPTKGFKSVDTITGPRIQGELKPSLRLH